MPSSRDNYLLREALINLKAGDEGMARRYLERALELADDPESLIWANYWMAQVTENPAEKRPYLEAALAYDPTHPEARKALAILDGKLKPDEIVNPEALPAQSTATKTVQADRFACPKCGARMVFDGDGRTLLCEHCGRNETPGQAAPQFEQDFLIAMATGKGHRAPVALKTFQCQGCGAQFLLPPEEISSVCAYCDSPHVVIVTQELVEPDSILPMAFNQRQAAQNLVKWVTARKITPEGKVQAPHGLYLPVWTFDIFGQVPWSGTIERNDRQVTVSGVQPISFDDIVVPGSAKLADLLPKIMPGFNTAKAPAYDPRYLSGWPAEIYQLTMSAASLEAREQAVEHFRAQVRHVNNLTYTTANLSVLSFKLLLVPVWLTSYRLEGRDLRILINGQSGQVYGETIQKGILGWLGDLLGT